MSSKTVTIEAAYLDTLLRRAQFYSDRPSDSDAPLPSLSVISVTIPKQEHDRLLESCRQYSNLRRNLYVGGISEETLSILIKDDTGLNDDDTPVDSSVTNQLNGGNFNGSIPFSPPFSPLRTQSNGQEYKYNKHDTNSSRPPLREQDYNTGGIQNHSWRNNKHGIEEEHGFPEGFFDPEDGSNENRNQNRSTRPQYDKFAKRTILLENLPEQTTHADIVQVIRGGMLLDIYLRTHERAASFSFLEESAAQNFYRYAKRHDLYIKGKRVEIRWSERQFILSGHVGNKIAMGATRNLVIYNRSPKHTEESIRDDLDHIHNLVVISVRFSGRNAMISLNSVHTAMYARTCMLSRSTYKGYKVEWEQDECASALEVPAQIRKKVNPVKRNAKDNITNRFQILNLNEDDGCIEDADTSD